MMPTLKPAASWCITQAIQQQLLVYSTIQQQLVMYSPSQQQLVVYSPSQQQLLVYSPTQQQLVVYSPSQQQFEVYIPASSSQWRTAPAGRAGGREGGHCGGGEREERLRKLRSIPWLEYSSPCSYTASRQQPGHVA